MLAPNARLRPAVVAIGRPEADAPDGDTLGPPPLPSAEGPDEGPDEPTRPAGTSRGTRRRWVRWAVLLARIYEVLPLLCPACGGTMTILAFLTDPPVVSAILRHMGRNAASLTDAVGELMILHGTDDGAVDWNQGLEFFMETTDVSSFAASGAMWLIRSSETEDLYRTNRNL